MRKSTNYTERDVEVLKVSDGRTERQISKYFGKDRDDEPRQTDGHVERIRIYRKAHTHRLKYRSTETRIDIKTDQQTDGRIDRLKDRNT